MAGGAGAHLDRFIEVVLGAILTCSGGASSKNWLGRWWMNGVNEHGELGGPTEYHRTDARRIGHVEVD